jgi:hypothetical protein
MNQDQDRGEWTSASNAQSDFLCPGRHLAQKGIPETETKDSKHGDNIHAALAGATPDGQLTVQERDIYESCKDIEQKLVLQFFGTTEGIRCYRERRVWIDCNTNKHSGRYDVLFYKLSRGLLLDYKTLTGEHAESPANLQLRDLAVMTSDYYLLSDIGVAIVQPLVTHSPTICTYDLNALKRSKEEICNRVSVSNDPCARRVPGEVQCNFCRAKNMCREYQQFAGSSLPVTKSLLDVPIAEWTGPMFAEFLSRKSVAQKWLDNAEEEAKKLLQSNPDAIPGYTLEEGNERTTITDPQEVYNRFLGQGGKSDQFIPAITLAKGKLKEAISKAFPYLKGKALDQKLNELLEGCVEKSQNKPSISKRK